jgi:hypothetical protein
MTPDLGVSGLRGRGRGTSRGGALKSGAGGKTEWTFRITGPCFPSRLISSARCHTCHTSGQTSHGALGGHEAGMLSYTWSQARTVKVPIHVIFRLRFFHETTPCGPLINHLSNFRILIRRDFRDFRKTLRCIIQQRVNSKFE